MNRLVILAPNWLGDAVMALPAMADVNRAAPATAITVAARRSIAPLFRLVSYVEDVIVLEHGVALPRRGPDPFDAALLLPNSFQAALTVFRSGIPERWGYRTDWRGRMLTRAIQRPPKGAHQVDYYQQLVHGLGFSNGPPEPRLAVPAAVSAGGADLLAAAGWDRRAPIVALAPGAAYGGAKRWSSASFAEVARGLVDAGVVPVLVGSEADRRAASEIESAVGGGRMVLNLIGGTDLPALAGVLANCRALVTNDSGAMHVAAATGVRVVALFGPTDEHATGPRGDVRLPATVRLNARQAPDAPARQGEVAHAVLTHGVWCRPCLLRECPLDHRCMSGIGADAVLAEIWRAS